MRALAVLVTFLVSACSNTLDIAYFCDPPGAALYQNGLKVGTCPMTLEYAITNEDEKRGYAVFQGITAAWVSGATSSVPMIRPNLSNGRSQHFNFERPRNVPGYDKDAMYALELRRNQILEDQAASQAAANYLRAYSLMKQERRRRIEALTPSAPVVAPPPTIYTTCRPFVGGLSPEVDCTSQ